MNALTAAARKAAKERKADERQRRYDRGLEQVTVWAHEDDRQLVYDHADALLRKRGEEVVRRKHAKAAKRRARP